MAPVVKEANIPYWGTKDTYLVTLPETGGYTTFAQDVTKYGDSAADLSYVHGVCNEYSDTENTYSEPLVDFELGDFTEISRYLQVYLMIEALCLNYNAQLGVTDA